MVNLCTDTPLPTFDSLYAAMMEHLTFPPKGFVMPTLPTLPSPMFPSLKAPNLEIVKTILELQSQQLMMTIMALVQPLVDFLGLSIDDIFPDIPGLNLNLIDILEGDAAALIAAVKAALANGINFPAVPVPFYAGLNMPDVAAVQAACNIVKHYMMSIPPIIFDLIDQVVGELEIPSMPSLPTMPSFEELMAALIAGIPNFPGFPPFPVLPSPLFPSISIPRVEFHEALGALMNHLTAACLQLIMDFVDDVLSAFIAFSFPTICIPFVDLPPSS